MAITNPLNLTPTGSSGLTHQDSPTNNVHISSSNYGKTNSHGLAPLSNPSSSILQRLTQLLPATSSTYPQIRNSRMADTGIFQFPNTQPSKQNDNYLTTTSTKESPKPRSRGKIRFSQSTTKFRPVPSLQFLKNLPSTTTISPINLENEQYKTGTEVPEISTSTSTSTSVSMSYTTVGDSAQFRTVLNTDHFLLSKKNQNRKTMAEALILSLQPPDFSSKSSTSRTNLPFEFYEKSSRSKNKRNRFFL